MSENPTVGVILDRRGDPPYVSVSKLWDDTINLLSARFPTRIHEVSDYFVPTSRAYCDFVADIDVLMLLSPYYSIDRTVKDFPVVAYGLGSLQKGGHWLYQNRTSFREWDSVVLNCVSCKEIYDEIVSGARMTPWVVPFGIDTARFLPRPNKRELRQKYGVPSDAFVMIYAGRISIQKNCHMLLGVLREARRKNPNVHLVVVGFFDDFYIAEFSSRPPPDSRTEFMRLVEAFDLSRNVTILEHQSDASKYAELLALADVGINLTTLVSENFGYTAVEMQACGLPVVGTDWAGLRDSIVHGETGFRVETTLSDYGSRVNVRRVVEYVDELMQKPALVEKMGRAARRHAEEKYGIAKFSENMQSVVLETFRSFCARRRSSAGVRYHPIVENLYETLQQQFGQSRHVSSERLHPALDLNHYRLILSRCATFSASSIEWTQTSRVSKGFYWSMLSPDQIVSYDPRWNTSFELTSVNFTESELSLLWDIDKYHCGVQELLEWRGEEWEQLSALLASLTQKGMIVQHQPEEVKDDAVIDELGGRNGAFAHDRGAVAEHAGS
jgi:glycosyltransferase involved in cell wall biosynthesis